MADMYPVDPGDDLPDITKLPPVDITNGADAADYINDSRH